MPDPTLHSGIDGTAKIGTTELAVVNWSVDPSVTIVRFNNSKTGLYTVKETTFKDCRFSIELDYDFASGASPFSSGGGGISIGTELDDVTLLLNDDADQLWTFPKAIVVGTPQRLEVAGKITTTINCESSGSWTGPTESSSV